MRTKKKVCKLSQLSILCALGFFKLAFITFSHQFYTAKGGGVFSLSDVISHARTINNDTNKKIFNNLYLDRIDSLFFIDNSVYGLCNGR